MNWKLNPHGTQKLIKIKARRLNKCRINKKESRVNRRLHYYSKRIKTERKVKVEKEKGNRLFQHIPNNSIIELNELIYTGAKLVIDKISDNLRNPNRSTKPGWEMKIEGQIRKVRKQVIQLTKVKRAKTQQQKENSPLPRKKQQQTNLVTHLKKKRSKIFSKGERLKIFWDKVKHYKQNRKFQNKKKIKILPTGWWRMRKENSAISWERNKTILE